MAVNGDGFQVEKIDIITAAMGHALATEGGFCTGGSRVNDHQVCDIMLPFVVDSLGQVENIN